MLYVCFLCKSRRLLPDDGISSYQLRVNQEPTVGIADLGEVVFFKAHGRHKVAKADSSLTQGMWIGKESDSGEHLIAIAHGAVESRTINILCPLEHGTGPYLT